MPRVAIVLLCVLAVLIGPTTAAQADTTTQLPFTTGAPWLAVDPSGGHVFVSAGPGNSSIVVLNYSGQIVKTITGEGGASQMALDPATHTLYVALHDATAISEIDTQTLTETKRFPTAPYPAPRSLVIAGGKLWFSCEDGNSGCLVSANLDGTGMAPPISGAGNLPLFLAAGGSNNHLLAFGYSEDSPPSLYVYDVSSSTPTQVGYVFDPNGGSADVADMTFDPSGSNLLLASGAPYYIQSLTATTLLSSAQYPTGPYPISVAVTADGNFVAGGINTNSGPDVFVYPAGTTTPVRTWQVGDDNLAGLPHSLAFSPDASRLFVVTKSSATGHLAFHVLSQPTVHLTTTGITLRRSAGSVRYGRHVRLKAEVNGTRSGTVDLMATTGGNIQKRVASAKLKSGRVTFSIKPKQNTTYTAQLEQGVSYASSTSKGVSVAVIPVLSVVIHPFGVVHQHGQRISRTKLIGHVRPALPSFEQLEFVVQRHLSVGWVTTTTTQIPIGTGAVLAYLTTPYPGLHRVQVVYVGDAAYRPSKSPWRRFDTP